jgi:hypothetical protein
MTTQRYLPYRTLGDRLSVHVESEAGELPFSPTGEVLGYELEDDPLRLLFRINDWRSDVDDVLPSAERKTPPVGALLVVRSDQSRRRFAIPIKDLECVHEFQRREWRGSVSVEAVVVRQRDATDPDEGEARDKAALLAWSKPTVIHFDEPARPPGDRLEVKWEDFRNSPDAWRRQHDDNIFALDLLSSERPIIRLNSALPNLKTVLNNAATHGRAARIRDATNFMIAHQAWTSLIASAMGSVREAHETSPNRPLEELLEELSDWEKRVLEDWARYVYPDHNTDDALDKILDACQAIDGVQVVMVRLANAIQTRFTTMKGFAGLVRDSRLFLDT